MRPVFEALDVMLPIELLEEMDSIPIDERVWLNPKAMSDDMRER